MTARSANGDSSRMFRPNKKIAVFGAPRPTLRFGPTQQLFSHSDEKNQVGKAKKTTVDRYKRQKEQENSSKAFVGRKMTLTVIFDQYFIT